MSQILGLLVFVLVFFIVVFIVVFVIVVKSVVILFIILVVKYFIFDVFVIIGVFYPPIQRQAELDLFG